MSISVAAPVAIGISGPTAPLSASIAATEDWRRVVPVVVDASRELSMVLKPQAVEWHRG